MKKFLMSVTSHFPKLQIIKNFLILELSQYRKIGSMFSSSEPVAASSDYRRLRNALCFCLPARPA